MTPLILFDPLIPYVAIAAIAMLAAFSVALALWRGLPGWWLRALASIVMLLALLNPALQQEERMPLSDIVILGIDESASQKIADRDAQTIQAITDISAEIARLPNTELRQITVGDSADNRGTLLMTTLSEALANEPQGRIAGVILLTDGRLHDLQTTPPLPAPLHALLTGQPDDWDRRLIIENAPAFAILGEPVTLKLRIEDQGQTPSSSGLAQLSIAIDGAAPLPFEIPIGQDIELPIDLPHGGMNVLEFTTPEIPGELTARNNRAVVQINGVRDRLRVLLVSGEPHPGERTWRNLLKSDAAVDLVHFTILRPPEKQDGVPVNELSLIAFPTRELFLEKIDEFDLIIFDRYSRRGILPSGYLENILQYVEKGGAVLVSSGPEYGSAESIYRSPLAPILPGAPTARVFEQPFAPQITDLGQKHPVTEGLDALYPQTEAGHPSWGRWFRHVDVTVTKTAKTVMSGFEDRPLLMLDRVGEGRVALIASDQSWLWDRGYEGGGPQLELLRRLAHWMMKEPDLEEEALWVEPVGQTMRIIRRTLDESIPGVEITGPNGQKATVSLDAISPGRYETLWDAPETGFYRLKNGVAEAVIALGPTAPREFEQTIASGDDLAPVVTQTRGGVMALSEGDISVRRVREGRVAAGRGWIGITPRNAYQTADIQINPLLPAWLYLLCAGLLSIGAWLREGRE